MHGCIKKESECAIVFPSPLNPCFGSNKRKKEPEKKDRRAIFFEEIESNKWVEHRQNKPKVHLGKISLTHGGTSVLDTDVCFYYVCLDGLLCVCVCVCVCEAMMKTDNFLPSPHSLSLSPFHSGVGILVCRTPFGNYYFFRHHQHPCPRVSGV